MTFWRWLAGFGIVLAVVIGVLILTGALAIREFGKSQRSGE